MYSKSNRIWYAEDCALLLIDYQPEVMDFINDKDPRIVELNVCALAKFALKLNIPVILSTVAVSRGIGRPTISSLKTILQHVEEIDRTSMDAWEDENLVNAVKATGKKKLVMAGILSSACLTLGAIHAMGDGFEVMFIEDATGDKSKEEHTIGVQRLIQAGAVPNSTITVMTEWFRDWTSPQAKYAEEIFPSLLMEINTLKGLPLPFWAKKNAPEE